MAVAQSPLNAEIVEISLGGIRQDLRVQRQQRIIVEAAQRVLAQNLDIHERGLDLRLLMREATNSQLAIEYVLKVYQLAASGEWQPDVDELRMLIYALLDNPALIPQVQHFVKDIFKNLDRLRSGWRYVRTFTPRGTRDLG